jgi:hypothetical protein
MQRMHTKITAPSSLVFFFCKKCTMFEPIKEMDEKSKRNETLWGNPPHFPPEEENLNISF